MSGVRRFVSFRRKPTQKQLEAPSDVDHKKSTEEEAAKKVGTLYCSHVMVGPLTLMEHSTSQGAGAGSSP